MSWDLEQSIASGEYPAPVGGTQHQWVGPGCSALGFIWGKVSLWTSHIDLGIQTASNCCPSEARPPRELSKAQVQGHGSSHSPALCSLRTTPACPSCPNCTASFCSVPQTQHPGYRVNEAYCARASLNMLLIQAMSQPPSKVPGPQELKSLCRALTWSGQVPPPTPSTFIRSHSFQPPRGPCREPSLCLKTLPRNSQNSLCLALSARGLLIPSSLVLDLLSYLLFVTIHPIASAEPRRSATTQIPVEP